MSVLVLKPRTHGRDNVLKVELLGMWPCNSTAGVDMATYCPEILQPPPSLGRTLWQEVRCSSAQILDIT